MPKYFQNQLLKWFDVHGRKDLPWQKNINPYRVWVSEIMLQQTQVSTAIPYFEKFMKRFPTIASLAKANENEVLHLWTGLGYYARARNLHKTAKIIHTELKGNFPDTVEQLETMPGIGHSTAGAIISISFGERAAILDGNVKRVLARFAGIQTWPGETETLKQLWDLSETLTPSKRCADYSQAIMDLGATLCTQRRPRCPECPLQKHCLAFKNNWQEDLPAKKKTKKNPTKELFFLILENKDQEILLEKRAAKGIWGGLWSLPECHDITGLKKWVKENYGLNISASKKLPPMKHTFSHYHLILTPIQAKVTNTITLDKTKHLWYKTTHQQKIGLAAPIKKLLEITAKT